jgi:hypothetical protein
VEGFIGRLVFLAGFLDVLELVGEAVAGGAAEGVDGDAPEGVTAGVVLGGVVQGVADFGAEGAVDEAVEAVLQEVVVTADRVVLPAVEGAQAFGTGGDADAFYEAAGDAADDAGAGGFGPAYVAVFNQLGEGRLYQLVGGVLQGSDVADVNDSYLSPTPYPTRTGPLIVSI